jgi:hypothetical protein
VWVPRRRPSGKVPRAWRRWLKMRMDDGGLPEDGGLPDDGVQLRRQVEVISHDLVSVDAPKMYVAKLPGFLLMGHRLGIR